MFPLCRLLQPNQVVASLVHNRRTVKPPFCEDTSNKKFAQKIENHLVNISDTVLHDLLKLSSPQYLDHPRGRHHHRLHHQESQDHHQGCQSRSAHQRIRRDQLSNHPGSKLHLHPDSIANVKKLPRYL